MLRRFDLEELQGLEEGMWRSDTRGGREWVDTHLASDFFELGLSGRRYDRGEVLDAEVGEIDAVLPLHPCTISGARTCATPTGCVMDFHQGNPTENG